MTRGSGSVSAAVVLLLAALASAGCGEESEDSASQSRPETGKQPAPAEMGRWTLGRWEGELHQQGLQPFMVWARVGSLSEAAANQVRYSGLGCRGRWTALGGTKSVYRFREEIGSGRSEKCKGFGIVTLRRLPSGRTAYSFRGGGVESRGVLSRVRPPG
jgi:hypothetical protein